MLQADQIGGGDHIKGTVKGSSFIAAGDQRRGSSTSHQEAIRRPVRRGRRCSQRRVSPCPQELVASSPRHRRICIEEDLIVRSLSRYSDEFTAARRCCAQPQENSSSSQEPARSSAIASVPCQESTGRSSRKQLTARQEEARCVRKKLVIASELRQESLSRGPAARRVSGREEFVAALTGAACHGTKSHLPRAPD